MSPEESKKLDTLIRHPHGMILLTGPTGSGKSTSLYAILQALARPEVNIITVEDPIEYDLPGVGQVQVNEKAGVTFATALRSILRQDPDIIMIGEMRDFETAHIGVQSSLTGHLVLSTLHTDDSVSAVSRLVDMGIECSGQEFADGTNADDIEDYRPGRKALAELGIRSYSDRKSVV